MNMTKRKMHLYLKSLIIFMIIVLIPFIHAENPEHDHHIEKDIHRIRHTQSLTKNKIGSDPQNCNDDFESLMRVEINTDEFGDETYWIIEDIRNNTVIYKVDASTYTGLSFNSVSLCVLKDSCYEFTIYDLSSDGFMEEGNYTVFFDDKLVKFGSGDFGFSESTIPLGNGCPTFAPSASMGPSVSTNPSQNPTSYPSSHPSKSLTPTQFSYPSALPSISSHPSFQPTILEPSSIPSSGPSAEISEPPSWSPSISPMPTEFPPENLISKDEQGRRYFPKTEKHPSDYISHETAADCEKFKTHPGCVNTPHSIISDPPEWAGTIYQKPSMCDKRRRCKNGVPNSIQVHDKIKGGLESIFLFGEKDLPVKIPGNTDYYTRAIIAVDINGDDFVDIVVGNWQRNHPVEILLNNGDGTFSEPFHPTLVGTSGFTTALFAADVNNDELVDVIVGLKGHHNQVLINKGNNLFEATVLPGISFAYTESIFVADIDNDGWLDIIVGNYKEPNELLINKGGKRFEAAILPDTGTIDDTDTVLVADLNNDSKPEIIVGGERNYILINSDDGERFKKIIALPLSDNSTTTCMATIDVNDDGLLDIIVGNYRENNHVLLNSNSNNLEDAFTLLELDNEDETQSISIGDIDNDGRVDVVFGKRKQPDKLFRNIVGDEYKEAFLKPIELPSSSSRDTFATALADFDNDGRVDFIFGHDRQANEILYNRIAEGGFHKSINIPGKNADTRSVVIADINNDGFPDTVFGNFEGRNEIICNERGMAFSKNTTFLGDESSKTRSITPVDVDFDGDIDLIFGHESRRSEIFINDGQGSFTPDFELEDKDLLTSSTAAADLFGLREINIILVNENSDKCNQIYYGGVTAFGSSFSGNSLSWSAPEDIPGCYKKSTSVSIADFNNDTLLDIVISNDEYQSNTLLINRGYNKTEKWYEITLPGKNTNTKSVAVADVNGDGAIDIVFGNDGQENEILVNNGDGSFLNYSLPDTSMSTTAVSVADVNSDGHIDLFFANKYAQDLLLINNGDGNFTFNIIPGSFAISSGLAVGDLNKDGHLDLVIATYSQQNKYMPFSDCRKGGARLHSKSNCFKCPTFMGRVTTLLKDELSTCRECIPDNLQQTGDGEQCDLNRPCFLGQRRLGEDQCSNKCPDGSFYHSNLIRDEGNEETWKLPRCVNCLPGGYANETKVAVNFCFQCEPGYYQPKSNSRSCLSCGPGTFSSDAGNDECTKCLPGTYNGEFGKSKCEPCNVGSSQSLNGQESCTLCPSGKYSNNTGMQDCTKCPYSLSSEEGSSTCSFCDERFYLKDIQVSKDDLFKYATQYCLECPSHAKCPAGTSIVDLEIEKGFWRLSTNTASIYYCGKNNKACIGTSKQKFHTPQTNQTNDPELCELNHQGPLCQVCTDSTFFFNPSVGLCSECPSNIQSAFQILGIFVGVIGLVSVLLYAIIKIPKLKHMTSSIGAQAKAKILISFYQIISSLEKVYGVRLSSAISEWFDNLLNALSFNFISLIQIPAKCMFTIEQRLLINSFWPYMLIVLIILLMWVYFLAQNHKSSTRIHDGSSIWRIMQGQSIQVIIVVLYLSLPLVCSGIFDAIKCRAFQKDDLNNVKTSYLLIDMRVECSKDDNNFQRIFLIFITVFIIWSVLTPLAFLWQLYRIRHSVQSNSISFIADASRFLWQDYEPSMLYWDVIDTIRKLLLSGIIMFVDIQEGSTRILRLIIANIISMIYFGLLLAFRPYKRNDDFNLAYISNLLLMSCFSLGIVLKACDNEFEMIQGGDICHNLVAANLSSEAASLFVAGIILSMLVITIIFMVILAYQQFKAPVVRLISSGHKPTLELPGDCDFHVFVSHVWATGQSQTHAIVRKMQLPMPDLKIWLDVDNLHSVDTLEESVASAAIFLLSYSKHYFRSKNCQREIKTAIQLKKPIIIVYEGDESCVDEIKQECIVNISEEDESRDLMHELFRAEEPIRWLKTGEFNSASLHQIYLRILQKLPFYQKRSHELNMGISVPGELSIKPLEDPVDILVYNENIGCSDIAQELKNLQEELKGSPNMITIHDAEDYVSNTLLQADTSSEPVHDEDGYDLSTPIISAKKTVYFLLYLNEYTFSDSQSHQKKISTLVHNCVQSEHIQFVLIHEQDKERGGCSFSTFFEMAPGSIYNPPNNLFNQLATPLYTPKHYRDVSLRKILSKIGAQPET